MTASDIMKTDLQMVGKRRDLLRMMLTETAQSLPPQEAAGVAQAIGQSVTGRLASSPISDLENGYIAADHTPVLAAFRRS